MYVVKGGICGGALVGYLFFRKTKKYDLLCDRIGLLA